MKAAGSLTNLIADFARLRRTPDFIPKDTPTTQTPPTNTTNTEKKDTRRHSVNISVGTEEIPFCGQRRRSRADSTGSKEDEERNKRDIRARRQSAPCVGVACLRKRLSQMKKARSVSDDDSLKEEDIDEIGEMEEDYEAPQEENTRKVSVSSSVYRI